MWSAKTKEQVLQELAVKPADGLTLEEAKTRLAKYGKNKLQGKPKRSLVILFFEQMKDMLIYVLLAATAITLFIGEYADAVIITSIVLINAMIGLLQEYKAGKAIEALRRLSSPHAIVRRNGCINEVRSEDVVPGDIVILDAGRYIPADLRLIESNNLQIEESALTGESLPSDKNAEVLYDDPKTPLGDLRNMAFMSTHVTYGRGEGVVVATGMNTEIGKIAKILDEDIDEMTPLQKRLAQLGRVLGLLAIGICVIMFGVAFFQGRDQFEMFLTAISLAVAAIPESLPAVVAIVLAVGVTRMAKLNAILTQLHAVETLGSVNIICSDKTGTLTQNKMTVVKSYTMNKLRDILETESDLIADCEGDKLIKSLVLCSDSVFENGEGSGDPTEIALIVLGNKFNVRRDALHEAHARVDENPFDSDRKLMSTLNQMGDGYRVHTKGALDNLLNISTHALVDCQVVPLTEELKNKYLEVADAMSDDALRILAVAYKDVPFKVLPAAMEEGLTLLGMVGMIDPPRLEVKGAIAKAKQAGITPIMITGDHKNTAVAIAKELGIAQSLEQSMTGVEIDQLTDDEFAAAISEHFVFARVSPVHKVKIVRAYKAQGNVVSMTGDGVNDAPSLRFADIGVAMGISGTDVSKEACDMILTDDNFTTIVHAIEEGRNIYSNIKKSVIFLLSCNLGEILTIFLAILFFWPVPLLPTQILWVNLITDSLPALALGVYTRDKDIMQNNPRDPKESFFARGAGSRVVLVGILFGLVSLGAFYLGLMKFGYTYGSVNIPDDVLSYARTMAFVVLSTSQLLFALSMGHEEKTIFQIGIFTNSYLLGAIGIGFVLQLAVIVIPVFAEAFKVQVLGADGWATVISLAIIPLAVNELAKVFRITSKNIRLDRSC